MSGESSFCGSESCFIVDPYYDRTSGSDNTAAPTAGELAFRNSANDFPMARTKFFFHRKTISHHSS